MLWERRDTGGYLAEIADIPDPGDRLRRHIANAVRLSQRRNVYAALSQVDSELAQAVLQRVANQRIAFLTGLYADLASTSARPAAGPPRLRDLHRADAHRRRSTRSATKDGRPGNIHRRSDRPRRPRPRTRRPLRERATLQ